MPRYQDHLDNVGDPQRDFAARQAVTRKIEALTGRPLIIYAADPRKPGDVQIDFTDKTGFLDLIEGIEGDCLDVLIHSPGGSVEDTEQIVFILRSRFDDIRYIVPRMAMSAATLMCFSGNAILMEEASQLGPIDPQVRVPLQGGPTWIPAQNILDLMKQADVAFQQQGTAGFAVYLPLISQFGIFQDICKNAFDLSKRLAREYLRKYMFAGDRSKFRQAGSIVDYFSSHATHRSHNRGITIEQCLAKKLEVIDLRDDPPLKELVRDLYNQLEILMDRSPALKIYENSRGVHWMRQVRQQQIVLPFGPAPQGIPQGPRPLQRPGPPPVPPLAGPPSMPT
jgi:hypothetical protein